MAEMYEALIRESQTWPIVDASREPCAACGAGIDEPCRQRVDPFAFGAPRFAAIDPHDTRVQARQLHVVQELGRAIRELSTGGTP